MSSTVFEVVLRPDPTLRRFVLGTGIAFLSAGIVLIASVQISLLWQCVLGLIWLADCAWEINNLYSGNARVQTLMLDSAGNVAAIDGDNDRHELILLTGSMVLPGLAWLRVRFSSGRCHAELFTAKRTGPEAWHRLQLLWHQSRDAFGHPPGP